MDSLDDVFVSNVVMLSSDPQMAYIDILCMRSRMLGNGSIKPNDNYVRSSQNHIHINVTPTYSKYLCFGGVERPPQSNHTHTKHVKKCFWKITTKN